MSLPNYLTFFRIFLVPFFFTELVSYHEGAEHHRWIAAVILVVACLTDALDGLLARILNMKTPLGQFLDPLADKLLLLSGYLGLLFVNGLPYHPPLWITVTIVFRDIVLLTGLVILFFITGSIQVQPNILGKCTTAFQMATLTAILIGWKISVALWYLTALFTILSCFSYVIRELKKMRIVS